MLDSVENVDTSKSINAENNPYDGWVGTEVDVDQADAFMDLVDDTIKDPEEDKPEPVAEADEVAPEDTTDEAPEEDNAEADEVEELSDDTEFVMGKDGEESTVTLAELKAGYFRQSDYTQKTTLIADERKETESFVEEAKEALSKYAFGNSKLVNDYAKLSSDEWDAMAQNEPDQYALHDRQYKKAQTELQQMNAEYNKLTEYTKLREAADVKAKAESAIKTLAQEVKGWNGDVYQSVLDFAKSEGVDESIVQSTDPQLLKLINEAMNARNAKAVVSKSLKTKKVVKNLRGSNPDANAKAKSQQSNVYDSDSSNFMQFT